MFCQECGQKLPEGAKHCPYCGAMVEAAPPPAPEETSLKREEEGVPKEVLSPEPNDPEAETPPPVKKTQKPKPQPPAPGSTVKQDFMLWSGLQQCLFLWWYSSKESLAAEMRFQSWTV